MTDTGRMMGAKRRAFSGPAFFSHGFRPFFFLGALYAALAIPLWLAAFTHGYAVGTAPNPLDWHIHEMIYGYLAAIIAGFLMTAIPNWTGRLPVMGIPLALFALLWFAGRVALMSGNGPVVVIVDSAFLIFLAGFAWREVMRGKNWRNVPICVLISLFALGNILFHTEHQVGVPVGTGTRMGLAIAALLMSLIGGRIIPSFTTNWLKKQGQSSLAVSFNRLDVGILAITAITLIGWTVSPDRQWVGYLLMLVGLLHLVRLARWKGSKTIGEPILLVLHIAYLWLPLAFLAMGLAIIEPQYITLSLALHLLTAGAVGQLTMAVMTRASLGHSGRELIAGPGTVTIYCLIFAGALTRFILPFIGFDYGLGMTIAGLLWCSGFLLFAIIYGPMLFSPRQTN